MEMCLALTDAKIRALKPRAKAYKQADFNGLYLYVTAKGSKLWRFKYRHKGKEGLLSFGPYPDISLKDARKMRDDARAQVANDLNPATVKRAEKAQEIGKTENTFNKVADQFVYKSEKDGKSDATLKKLKWLLEEARKDFGNMPITDITSPIILKTLRKREKTEHYETAHRMRSRIGGVFRFAVASGICDNDPTYALRDALIRPQVQHRAAITTEEEMKDLLTAMDEYTGSRQTVIALKLLIQFACRPGEIRQSQWNEFDFEKRIWNVPKERMKMRRAHQVPLPQCSIDLLNELKELTGWGEFLFPAQTTSKKPMSDNTLTQALRRMGFKKEKVTPHGFRSTFSTFANESGLWNPDVIEAYCARQDRNAVRRAYNRAAYWNERVKIAEWWEEFLKSITTQDDK